MSSKPNHRRGHARVQERGPRYENPDPAAGCNATHVARARRKRHDERRRAERRAEASKRQARPPEALQEPSDDLDETAERIAEARNKPQTCAVCGTPATCFGEYETCDGTSAGYACDTCCGHGNEDGWCEALPEGENDE